MDRKTDVMAQILEFKNPKNLWSVSAGNIISLYECRYIVHDDKIIFKK